MLRARRLVAKYVAYVISYILLGDLIYVAYKCVKELILFKLRPEIICVDMMSYLQAPLLISLTTCASIGIVKLYRRLMEKPDLHLNKTLSAFLIFCVVASFFGVCYSFVANKTEVRSDGEIKIYDSMGRIQEIRAVNEAKRIQLKAERFDYTTDYGYGIMFYLTFPDGEIIDLDSTSFRDVEAMKELKALSGDKLIITHTTDTALEILGTGDKELYDTYIELFPKFKDRPLTYYEENWNQFTKYEFGQ